MLTDDVLSGLCKIFSLESWPQACLKSDSDTKKQADVSRWFSFSEFGAKGITQPNDYQYYYLQNLRVKGSAKKQDI